MATKTNVLTEITHAKTSELTDLLHLYAAHNLWANQKITGTINILPEEKIQEEAMSSFTSIFKTVLHLLDAESIWWQRIKLAEHLEIPSQHFSGNFLELQQRLLQQSLQFEQLVSNAHEYQLLHVFAYQRSKSEQCKQTVLQALLHLFNHQSYHRGQLVTLLRQAGITKIPSTDIQEYTRQKKQH